MIELARAIWFEATWNDRPTLYKEILNTRTKFVGVSLLWMRRLERITFEEHFNYRAELEQYRKSLKSNRPP